MFVQHTSTRVLQNLFVLCLFSVHIHGKCKTTYITKCEKTTDISRYGKQSWTNLVLENDECGKDVFEPPSEVLKFRAFNKTLNLEEMYIVEKLVDIQPGAFDGLDKLTYLKLYKNVIKVIPRGAFGNITKLLKLDLQDNSIENIQHGLFANSSITLIDLSYNKINNVQVDMVAVPSLKKLIITNNDISLLVPNCFHENLQHLNLDSNKLSDIDEGVMKPLKNLKELILSNNEFKGISIPYGLPSLEILDFSHNQIEGIKEGSFKEFLELKALLLGYNHLTYLNPNIFSEENNIEVIHLHQNRLMNLDERVGTNLPHLREMSIGGNPWACSCLGAITVYFEQKKIRQPDCEREFFTKGISAVCWVTSDTCTGNEILTKEIFDEFQAQLKYTYC